MTLLSETAHVLTHVHLREKPEGGYGQEPALLDLLASSVSASSQVKAGGTAKTGVPLDLGALDLWTEITRTIDGNWPHRGDPAYVKVPHTGKLTAWVNTTLDPVVEADLVVLVQAWVHRIREHLEPTKRFPLAGVTCPLCGWHRTAVEDEEGHWTYRPALVAYPTADPLTVTCTVEACSGEWQGPEVVDTFMKGVTTDRPFV